MEQSPTEFERRQQHAADWVEEWMLRPGLERLARRFGAPARADRPIGVWLAELEAFSAVWDFRAGNERNQSSAAEFDVVTEHEILGVADELGMRAQSSPRHRDVDVLLVLGGLVRACLARPAHARALLDDGVITAKSLVALGGHRELGGNEIAMADEFLGRHDLDEFGAMDASVRRSFALDQPTRSAGAASEVLGEAWSIREYEAEDGMPVIVVAAPSSEPGRRRANTADTYAWLADSTAWLRQGQTCGIVTTQLYKPFQEADAWRVLWLQHGVRVEAIGMDPGLVDERLAQDFKPHQYLQEIRSALISMRRLLEASNHY